MLTIAAAGLGALILSTPGGGGDRIALLVITPSGELNHVRSAEIVSFVDRTVDARTDLELDLIDPASVRECRGRISCFVQTARPDYDRRVYFLPSGEVAPFDEHRRWVEDRGLSVARYLLVASGVGTPTGDALTFTLIDVDAALAWRHRRDELDRTAEIELSRAATRARLRSEVARPADVAPVLAELRDRVLAPSLDATGHWDPFGRVVLETNVAGAGIYVDDRLVATTRLEPTPVERLAPGPVRLRVEHPDHRTAELEVVVTRGETARRTVELERRPPASARAVHRATFWSGLGLVGAGVAFTVAGAIDAANAPSTACTDCRSRFTRISTSYPDDPTAAPNESGPLTVPLGYSLALTGATWSLGSLVTDRDRVPWWPLLGGLVAGGLAYGVSEAVR